MTYESKLTGEPVREVNFYLPASNVPLLRQLPGFEDFDPQTEGLHCDKPGTGLADAPRAFSIKLRGVTEDKCHMVSSQVDPEMCFRHQQDGLVPLLNKHVDDLKLTGTPAATQHILSELQKVFGELKIEWQCLHQLWSSICTGCPHQRDHIGPDRVRQEHEVYCSPAATRWKTRRLVLSRVAQVVPIAFGSCGLSVTHSRGYSCLRLRSAALRLEAADPACSSFEQATRMDPAKPKATCVQELALWT